MLRPTLVNVLCPAITRLLARNSLSLPKRLPHLPPTAAPCPQLCRCLSTSGQLQQKSQPLDNPTPVTDIKEHLSKLSEKEQEDFARAALDSLTPEESKRLRVLEMEYDVWMSTGVAVPEEITLSMWLQLLHTPSQSGRSKLYRFWFKRQNKKLSELKKKEARQQVHLERREKKRQQLEQQGREEGLPEGEVPCKNAISLFIRPKTMLQHYYNNLAWAMQHGQPVVLDLSLESHMRDRERTSVIKQIMDSYGVNKVDREPFNWVMAGLKSDGFINKKLQQIFDQVPVTLTSEDYMSLYPSERLVYLTPNSPHELLTWDPEAVYVVGALVDLADEKPITFAKARRQKIRTARLPLDRYLMWEQGSKALTLDVMFKILCEMKNSGNWVRALQHIPKRKAKLRAQYLKKGLEHS